jgi:hypothetical protein
MTYKIENCRRDITYKIENCRRDITYKIENCICNMETDEAILVDIPSIGVEWIPKSQVTDDSEVCETGDEGDLVITDWLAEQRGWA